MPTEIKPCPHCGGEATVNMVLLNSEAYRVCCKTCRRYHKTQEEAIDAWNKRTTPATSTTTKKELKMTIDWTKPLRTVGTHLPVEFISDKGRFPDYPYLAYVGTLNSVCVFSSKGTSVNGRFSVENVPEEIMHYVNFYSADYHHTSRVSADSAAAEGTGRVACIRVTYTPGQFDG